MNGKAVTPGETHGRLKFLDFFKQDEYGNLKWACQCDCGEVKYFYPWQLRSGDSVSCGCYRKENVAKINRENPRRKNALTP